MAAVCLPPLTVRLLITAPTPTAAVGGGAATLPQAAPASRRPATWDSPSTRSTPASAASEPISTSPAWRSPSIREREPLLDREVAVQEEADDLVHHRLARRFAVHRGQVDDGSGVDVDHQ